MIDYPISSSDLSDPDRRATMVAQLASIPDSPLASRTHSSSSICLSHSRTDICCNSCCYCCLRSADNGHSSDASNRAADADAVVDDDDRDDDTDSF